LQELLQQRDNFRGTTVPDGTYSLVAHLLENIPLAKVFVVLDIFRLLMLHPIANEYYVQGRDITLENVLKTYFKPQQPMAIPSAVQLMMLRLITNIFATPLGIRYMIEKKENLSLTVEAILQGLHTEDPKKRLAGSSLAFNCSLFIPKREEDSVAQCLTTLIESLQTEKDEETEFTSLMAIGKLIYGCNFAVQLVKAMEFNVQKYKESETEKIQLVAKEIEILIK